MNTRLRISLVVLAILIAGNVAWRVWANWGLITIDAADRPVGEVIRSIEKQGGVRLLTNLPAETKITMHVRKVSLVRGLDVLGASANANWSLGYFAAADKPSIDQALTAFSSGQPIAGWKRFSPPQMPAFGLEVGSTDPRQERWEIRGVAAGTLHTYLEQGAIVASAQFWTPETWNPAIASVPSAGKMKAVLPKLVKAAHGSSVEVFLLSGQRQFSNPVTSNDGNDGERRGPRNPGAVPTEEMRKAMEQRAAAQIDKLPPEKRAEASADLEGRKKFFEEMAALPPEQRMAKMQEKIEEFMNSQKAAKFESQMTKQGAMKTAEQRNEFYRQVLSFRNKATK